jgi:hypothetical protein
VTNHRDTYARYEMDHPTDDDDMEARADDTATERLQAALDREDRRTMNYPTGWPMGGGL